jgi:hypothetical protein
MAPFFRPASSGDPFGVEIFGNSFVGRSRKIRGLRAKGNRRGALRRAAVGRSARRGGPSLAPRQILSVWKYLAIHFSADRGKSEGCGQKEACGGLCGAPPSGAPRRIARQILSVRKYLAIHFSADLGKSEGCGQKEAGAGLCGAPPPGAPSRIAWQILSVRKYLAIRFSADRGKSEGCRQKETGAGLCGALAGRIDLAPLERPPDDLANPPGRQSLGSSDQLAAPSAPRAFHDAMAADFPLDRAEAGGGRGRGDGWVGHGGLLLRVE